jgi:hypothetical protein
MNLEQYEQQPQLRISADGVWYYGDEPLERLGLVRLFYTVLKRNDSEYRIITPVESIPVVVEDAPYSVVAVRYIERNITEKNNNEGIECILNDETLIPLTNTCFPRIGANNALYIQSPNGFEARFTRAAFMQLSAYIQEEKNGGFSIRSFGQIFPITML